MQIFSALNINLQNKVKKEDLNKIMLNWEVPATKSKKEAWEELSAKINPTKLHDEKNLFSNTHSTKVISIRKKLIALTAIAAVLIAGFLYFTQSNDTVVRVAEKQNSPVILPDGSKVWLNANSELVYNKTKWNQNREITLKGEGYFEVKKGKQFKVITDYGNVTVLGTSFDVLARKNFYEVECYTGKVAVTAANDQKILTPGKATYLHNNQLKAVYNIQELNADWTTNKFRFENQPLPRVFDEVSQTFKVDIKYDLKKERFFSGIFNINDLESTLKTICLSMDLKYSIQGTTVIISE